jgi:CRP-like cAMP-binding protein
MPRDDPDGGTPSPGARSNALLDALPDDLRAALAPRSKTVTLPVKLTLYEMDRPFRYVYFPHRGVASLVKPMDDDSPVEVATIGPEGLIGLPVALGAVRAAERAFVQVPGVATRLDAKTFRDTVTEHSVLRDLLMRYALALMAQMAQGAACNRSHPVDERCARWLLMTHDRVDSDEFPLTQDFLAQMLGVRRPSVSIAAGMLQRAGLIHYVRGVIRIRDRKGLEAASCECYAAINREYERVLGKQVQKTRT